MDYSPQNMDEIYKRMQALTEKAKAELAKEGFVETQIYVEASFIFSFFLSYTH